MTPVGQYVYDGSAWRPQVRTRRSSAEVTVEPEKFWRTPHPQNTITGRGADFARYAAQPCFVWTGQWNPKPQPVVADYVSRAAGRVLPLCLYAFPRTGYSAGGFNDLPAYRRWVDAVSAGVGTAPCTLVVEPDALGLHENMADGTTPEQAVAYVVARFRRDNPRTGVFLDASNWVDAGVQAERLRAAGVADAGGFCTNVANFKTTTSQVTYCESVNARLEQLGVPARRYLIDTGRNGNGELTRAFGSAAAPWLDRGLGWLNPPGRGLGLSPRSTPDAAHPDFAAAVWVKGPGESDGDDPGSSWRSGYFPDQAPVAGTYWLSWIEDCLAHTDMANLSR